MENAMGKRVPSSLPQECGVTLIASMIIMLMISILGVAALTMSGIGNSTIGALRMTEEGTAAAESCVGVGASVIQRTLAGSAVPLGLQTPLGPVPSLNAATLNLELQRNPANSADCAVMTSICGVAVPNLTMVVNNYGVNGDIDSLFTRPTIGSPGIDEYFRIDCTATNAATGTQARVIAIYDCVQQKDAPGICIFHNAI
jgi:hypothetical protein